MYGSLSWIEWLDRLHRVLAGARQDVAALSRGVSPQGLASLARSTRQLASLSNELPLLDRDVLSAGPELLSTDVAANLQRALDTASLRLRGFADVQPDTAPVIRDHILGAIDAALRDSRYEAARLVEPKRRRA